jgi:hypothetical protein
VETAVRYLEIQSNNAEIQGLLAVVIRKIDIVDKLKKLKFERGE